MKLLPILLAFLAGGFFGTIHPIPLPPALAKFADRPTDHRTTAETPARKFGSSVLDRPAYK